MNGFAATLTERRMTQIEKVLYTGKTRTSGGRDGTSRSSDGRLDVRLSSPGAPGTGTNPEQLLAAAWSACLISAIKQESGRANAPVPASVVIDAEVDLATVGAAYLLRARLNISLPGLTPEAARVLVDAAQQTCPFSNATRGNIDVTINVL
jgi:lipoyl-dependent peroxiredoxin